MNDDMEQLLGRLTPRGVRPELRPQVLAAVASQLKAEPASPWLRRSAWAVAASILVGIAMNIGVSVRAERRLAQLYGPPSVSKQAMELANAVEEVSDAQTAQWVYQRFAVARRSEDGLAAYMAYNDMLIRILNAKEPFDEAPQKDSQMDRDCPGRAGGDRSDCQRHFRLDYRCTA
jgi:hypothetical protein